MTQATYAQARRVVRELSCSLTDAFGVAASGPVADVVLSDNRVIGYHAVVKLARKATADEKKLMPHTHKGVLVRYEVTMQ